MAKKTKRQDREILKYTIEQTVHRSCQSTICKIIITYRYPRSSGSSYLCSHSHYADPTACDECNFRNITYVYFTELTLRSCFVPSKMMKNHI